MPIYLNAPAKIFQPRGSQVEVDAPRQEGTLEHDVGFEQRVRNACHRRQIRKQVLGKLTEVFAAVGVTGHEAAHVGLDCEF